MAHYSEKGLTLRWDAPDLAGSGAPGATRVVVAARPAHPSNVVTAVYTVDGGAPRVARGFRLPAPPRPIGEDRFAVDLPRQAEGARVAFVPVLSCSGREADPRRGGFAPTPVTDAAAPAPGPAGREAAAPGRIAPSHPARFAFEPEFLFRVTAPVHPDRDPVGETPDGLRMKFLLRPGGFVHGPAVTGEILPLGGDWMRIRPDGVGVAQINALIRPQGGGSILTEYSGIVDFGPDGYRLLAAGGGPKRAPLRFAPRYLTTEPRFAWLNRLQCFSVGEVDLERYIVEYDLYAFRTKPSDTI